MASKHHQSTSALRVPRFGIRAGSRTGPDAWPLSPQLNSRSQEFRQANILRFLLKNTPVRLCKCRVLLINSLLTAAYLDSSPSSIDADSTPSAAPRV